MRVLVTGISGFVGRHVAAWLAETGHEVVGFDRSERPLLLGQSSRPREKGAPAGTHVVGDVRDGAAIRHAIRVGRPDAVIHLAGHAFVPDSFERAREVWDVNAIGAVELLDAVRRDAPEARVLIVTSGEVYGRVDPEALPIEESQPFRPLSPYSASKAAADLAAGQAAASGLDVVRARPFQHTGPFQAPVFVCPEFARAVARAESGSGPRMLRVGNLDVERDYTDVRDVARAYLALLERGLAGEAYNVASGRVVRVGWILDRLRERARVPIEVEVDPAKLRPGEIPRVEVSIEKIRGATGWTSEIPLEQTVDELLEHWRSRESA